MCRRRSAFRPELSLHVRDVDLELMKAPSKHAGCSAVFWQAERAEHFGKGIALFDEGVEILSCDGEDRSLELAPEVRRVELCAPNCGRNVSVVPAIRLDIQRAYDVGHGSGRRDDRSEDIRCVLPLPRPHWVLIPGAADNPHCNSSDAR